MIPLSETLLNKAPFSLPQAEKEGLLLPLLQSLTLEHKVACPAYRKIVDLAFPHSESGQTLADLPFLPLSLFRHRALRSIPNENVQMTLLSSGTTAPEKSHVDLDDVTLQLAARAMVSTIHEIIGKQNLPMLVLDAPLADQAEEGLGARTSIIRSLMTFGHEHVFALHAGGALNEDAIEHFLAAHKGQPFLLFGFTDKLWETVLPAFKRKAYDLSGGILLHTGGWRQLTREYIDNETFSTYFTQATNLSRVVNFYGMVEMIGTLFVENTDGLLYVPAFADVIIRDPVNFKPVEDGSPGLIQVLSLIPRSYPGHSLLTEDVGMIQAIDTGVNGWKGKALRFLGRVPKTTLRDINYAGGTENIQAA